MAEPNITMAEPDEMDRRLQQLCLTPARGDGSVRILGQQVTKAWDRLRPSEAEDS
jgi:hypothetical protein